MNFIQKILTKKYGWLILPLAFAGITYAASLLRFRIDLTAEKRYSLTQPVKDLLSNLDSTVNITVYLAGELPADYKKLSIATQDMLALFTDASYSKVQVHVENAVEGLNDTAKLMMYDSLASIGLPVISEDKTEIIPGAMVSYKNKMPFIIDLRSSRKVFNDFNVINDDPSENKEATRNAAEALLEFKFANAIDKLTRTEAPVVAYVTGNGEPADLRVNDLGESMRNDYVLGTFNLKQGYPKAEEINALVIVKPTIAFTDEDKLKLDQYIMHGGKIIWCIDKLYAEFDSLLRSHSDFVAFDRNLNVDDILFKYGVRINGDLLQDLNCSKVPVVVGQNPNGSPVMQRIPWPYYPFLQTNNENPVSKNLERVLPIFPSSMDTIAVPGIKKTYLLVSDTNSRRLSTPAIVSLNSVKDDADFLTFNKSYVPVAVLLEGSFPSLFANRLTKQIQDSVQKSSGELFTPVAVKPAAQIVMSDADIVTNMVSPTTGPLPMGELLLEDYRFANREFFLNCLDYLVSKNEIFQSRNKDFKLRLLDKKKVQDQKPLWQFINIGLPILLIGLFGFFYQRIRIKKYAL